MQKKDGAIHEILLPNLGLLWRIKNKNIKTCFEFIMIMRYNLKFTKINLYM